MSSLFNDLNTFIPIKKRIGLGFQYVGSKEMITTQLIAEIYKYQPQAKYAYDLFGGGGAMSFAFLESGLKVRYNEIKSDLCLLYKYVIDCIKNPRNRWGIFDRDLYLFCDRTEFNDIREKYKKGTDLTPQQLIKRYCYSFNSMGITYFKNEFKTKFAKAGHNLVFMPFLDIDYKQEISVFGDYFGDELKNNRELVKSFYYDFCENKELLNLSWIDRLKLFTSATIIIEALSITQLLNEFKGVSFKVLANYPKKKICNLINIKYLKMAKELKELKELNRLTHLERIIRLEQLQQLQQLQRLEQLQQYSLNGDNFTITNLSYNEYDFSLIAKALKCKPNEIIIYCDIPYQISTKINKKSYGNNFDIKEFCEWTKIQVKNGFKVFLSEYHNPDENIFKEILTIKKVKNIGRSNNNFETFTKEKLFLATKD